jgi:hypothetical protein
MIARVARFEGVDRDEAVRLMPEVESILRPVVEGLPGYRGRLDLFSADGTQLSITLYDSPENADAGEPVLDEELPRLLGGHFGSWAGRRVSVERYDVLVDERP